MNIKNGETYNIQKSTGLPDFTGKINGQYFSINIPTLKKYKSEVPEYKIMNGKNAINLFYNNGMLVLSSQNLGINLSDLSLKEKQAFGFRNSFGYTAIQETNLQFDESRTTITDDNDSEFRKYLAIIKEIYNLILFKYREIDKQNSLLKKIGSKEGDVKKIPSNFYNSKITKTSQINLIQNNKLIIKTDEEIILDLLESVTLKLDNKNIYYQPLDCCIGELRRILVKPGFITDFNISYHAVIRTYCEITFIYKIYSFYTNHEDLNSIIDLCIDKKTNDYFSIGALLNIIDTKASTNKIIKRFNENFLTKTNQNNFNNVKSLIKKLNNHIHSPKDGIDESISKELIKIFSNWL